MNTCWPSTATESGLETSSLESFCVKTETSYPGRATTGSLMAASSTAEEVFALTAVLQPLMVSIRPKNKRRAERMDASPRLHGRLTRKLSHDPYGPAAAGLTVGGSEAHDAIPPRHVVGDHASGQAGACHCRYVIRGRGQGQAVVFHEVVDPLGGLHEV